MLIHGGEGGGGQKCIWGRKSMSSKIFISESFSPWIRPLCGISNGTFEIPYKTSHPYIERYDFYIVLNIHELSDSRVHMRFCIPETLHTNQFEWPGPWFNIKMTSYQYRKSHCGDKTIWRPSYLHNGISHTGKMPSLYWIRAQIDFDRLIFKTEIPTRVRRRLYIN